MRRFLPLGAILLILVAGTQDMTRAQTVGTPTPTPSPTPTPFPSIDPSHFNLSLWAFPPPARVLDSRVESNVLAGTETDVEHFGPSFLTEGRLTGYFQDAGVSNVDSKGKPHEVVTYDLVSTFASPDQAAAALQQQENGWETRLTVPPAGLTGKVIPFSGQFGDEAVPGLYSETFTATSGAVVDRSELVFKRGIYLIEVFQENLHKDASYGKADRKYQLAIGRTLDNVASGKVAGPPKPSIPKGVKIKVLSTRFESNTVPSDFQAALERKPVTKVATGSTVRASMYFVVKSAPPNSSNTVYFTLSRGNTAARKKLVHRFGSYPPDYYVAFLYNITLRLAGTYKLSIKLISGRTTKTGTAFLTVTGRRASRLEVTRIAPRFVVQPVLTHVPPFGRVMPDR